MICEAHYYTLEHNVQLRISAIKHLVCTLTLRGRLAMPGIKAQRYEGNGICKYDSCVFCIAGLLGSLYKSLEEEIRKSRRQKLVLHHSNTLGTLSSGQGKNKVDVRRRYKSLCGCVSETERYWEHFVFPSQNRWDWVWHWSATLTPLSQGTQVGFGHALVWLFYYLWSACCE